MRRMYSEQELTNVIKKVFEEELESGALDELVSDAVDAYLVEHPVDITALDGQTIAPAVVNATTSIGAPSIVETMTGYSASITAKDNLTNTPIYVGAVKNGNKLTFVYFASLIRTGNIDGFTLLCNFSIPEAIGQKLYPYTISLSANVLDYKKVGLIKKSDSSFLDVNLRIYKSSNTQINVMASAGGLDSLEVDAEYLVRYEVTFLLSDSLISE